MKIESVQNKKKLYFHFEDNNVAADGTNGKGTSH